MPSNIAKINVASLPCLNTYLHSDMIERVHQEDIEAAKRIIPTQHFFMSTSSLLSYVCQCTADFVTNCVPKLITPLSSPRSLSTICNTAHKGYVPDIIKFRKVNHRSRT